MSSRSSNSSLSSSGSLSYTALAAGVPSELVERISRLEKENKRYQLKVPTLEAVIAAQCDQIESKQREIIKLKKKVQKLKTSKGRRPSRDRKSSTSSTNQSTGSGGKPRPHIISHAPYQSTVSDKACAIELPQSHRGQLSQVCNPSALFLLDNVNVPLIE